MAHQDLLAGLNTNLPLNARLRVIHNAVKIRFPYVDRIAVALYESKSGLLKTFLGSSGRDYPLNYYEASLESVPSLKEIVERGEPRVIDDLSIFQESEQEHTKSILRQGYASSYTTAMYFNQVFSGFVFFNSYQKSAFGDSNLNDLDVYSHLISQMVGLEVVSVRAMLSALRAVNDMLAFRDPQSEQHLNRMAQYARLIARELGASGRYDLTDEDVERIFWFAPFHGVGKIAGSDIHVSPIGQLEDQLIRGRAARGIQLINSLIEKLGFESLEGLDVLRNIAQYYSEKVDGSGPAGLKQDEIPVEARIVAVAEIFNSLTSRRYNSGTWSNEDAISILERLSFSDIDRDCVVVLRRRITEIERIQSESFHHYA